MRKRLIFTLLSLTLLVVWTAYPDDVTDLRMRGQLGVDELHAKWKAAEPADRIALQKTLDQVCAQKDCHASRLYWYTNLDDAKVAARRTGKPILSLHLLGHLDEELSCANSRFFRTLLYSDDAVSTLMRDRFVLHWHSVREVPRVTIELGGGRVIRQTVTGNSAHYLLDEEGRPLDVLPGMYSSTAFRNQLERWVSLHDRLRSGKREDVLARYHSDELIAARVAANELGIDTALYAGLAPVWQAQAQSMSKAVTERPLLRRLSGTQVRPRDAELNARVQRAVASGTVPSLVESIAFDPWNAIGEQRKGDVHFGEGTLALMGSKQKLTDRLLDNLRRSVAGDTAFNEYDLHLRAHEWFVSGEVKDLYSLNERVYDELFLTPSSDPWLGLLSDSVFTGIEPEPKPTPEIGG
jgi:hypothetical protein